MKFGGVSNDYPMQMNLYADVAGDLGLVDYKSKWCLRCFANDDPDVGLGLALFTFIYLLSSHLLHSDSKPTDLLPYYTLNEGKVGPRMYFEIIEP